MDEKELREIIRQTIISQLPYKREGILAMMYYSGKQWPRDVKEYLDSLGKPALTYNYFGKVVNFLLGIISRTKFIERFLPRNAQSVPGANIATEIVKDVYLRNNAESTFKKIFLDSVVRGEGFVKVWVDYFENPQGVIKIGRVLPQNVFYDPNSTSSDFSDADYVFEIIYAKKEELKEVYGDYADVIESIEGQGGFILIEALSGAFRTSGILLDYDLSTTGSRLIANELGLMKDKIEVVRFQKKTLKKKYYIYDQVNRTYTLVPEVPEKIKRRELEEKVAKLNRELIEEGLEPRFSIRTEMTRVIEVITFLPQADVILDRVENPWGVPMFDIIPFFGYEADEEKFGLFRLVKDAQDELNKKRSLEMEILKKTPINKFFVPKSAFADEAELQRAEERLEDDQSYFIEINAIQGFPQPIETNAPNKIAILNEIVLRSELQLKDIAGMTDAIMGVIPRKIQSGKAIERLQEASIQHLSHFIDNYKQGRKILAKLIFEIAKRIYPNDYVLRIVRDEIGEVDFQRINVMLGEKNILNLWEMDFDVVVEQSEDMPVLRLEYLNSLIKLAQLGVPVPPPLFFDLMNLPTTMRKQIMDFYNQLAQKQNTENNNE